MINFFNNNCNEASISNKEFGICDDQNGTKAYTDNTNSKKWIATIKNDKRKKIVFTAIDNCIIILKEETSDKESTCDGMLTFENSLFLVELKVQRQGGWLPRAISQLENTIKLIKKHNDISKIKYKKAYACNKIHPRFQIMASEQMKRFFDKTGFRIDVQAEIKIK